MTRTKLSRRNGLLPPKLALLLALPLSFGCGEPETVTIGAVLPLSGSSTLYGQQIAQGLELALEQYQTSQEAAAEIELKVVDTESDPSKAREALRKVYADGARAAIGGITTAEAQAMVAVADGSNRVLLSPSASAKDLSGTSRGFYRLWPSDAREGSLMGKYAARNLELATVVVLAAENAYAQGISEAFQGAFEENGGKIQEVIRYPAEGAELAALAKRAVAAKADSIYLADYATPVVELIRKLRSERFRGEILTVSAFVTPQALEAAGKAAEGVFVTHPQFTPEDQSDPRVRAFVDAYREKYGEAPGLYAAHGYDSMQVIIEALNRGGDTGGSFWKGMRSVENLPGVTGPIQFDERGDVLKYPRPYMVQGGRTVDHAALVKKRQDAVKARMEELRKERENLLRRARG